MAITKYLTTPTPHGLILPANYIAGNKYPVGVFLHGIGETSKYKTLQEAVDFHWWLKKAADAKGIIFLVPQDNHLSLFDDAEVVHLLPTIDKYSDGRLLIAGLSRGGGTTLSILMSSSLVKSRVTTYLALCPGNWEGMNEQLAAQSNVPLWIIAGAKDTAVTIQTIVNTTDDIIRAGRKENFYLSVINGEDHYLWNEVMGAMGAPFITPLNSAKEWKGTNNVGGQTVSVTVPCVNDPAVDVYDFFLMQRIGAFKPLPRLAAPTPTPVPTTDNYIKDVNYALRGGFFIIQWTNGPQTVSPAQGDAIVNVYDRVVKGQRVLTVDYANAPTVTYGPKR